MGWRSAEVGNCAGAICVSAFSQVGKANAKVEPLFRPGLCAVIVPLCASTRLLLIASPRPSPPNCVRPPCSKALNSFGNDYGSIAMPVSAISTHNLSDESLLVLIVICPFGGVNFTALLIKFQKICCSRAEIGRAHV